MILRRAASPSSLLRTPANPSPEASPCPSIFSAPSVASWDDDAMSISTEHQAPSRPLSIAPSRPPSLQEILQNRSSPPYTLQAFTAYLSQKQCLENLEFTMDARRYAQQYDEFAADTVGMPMVSELEGSQNLNQAWQRLVNTYIAPGAHKEVNLPDHIRKSLLECQDTRGSIGAPPAPEILEQAVEHIIELMDESVMMGFISEHAVKASASSHGKAMSIDYPSMGTDSDEEPRRGHRRLTPSEGGRTRSRSRRKYSPELRGSGESSSSWVHGKLPIHAPPLATLSTTITQNPLSTSTSRGSVGSAAGSGDVAMTDEAGGSTPSSPSDLMTPPTTPPGADLLMGGGGSSPRTKTENTWKRMMGKFGAKNQSAKNRSSSRTDR